MKHRPRLALWPVAARFGARTWLCCLAAVALVACNDGSSASDDDTGVADTGMADVADAAPDESAPDVAPDEATDAPPDDAPDQAPEVTEPPEPTLVVVSLSPTRAVYPVGTLITPSAVVYDQYAEVMDRAVNWSVDPRAGASAEGDRWRIAREGAITFRACVPLDDRGDLNMCGTKTIMADRGSPVIEIYTPAPGAELLAAENPVITVSGRAYDTNGALRVFVAGQRARLDAEGNFSVDVRPIYGVNHIEVVASDGLNNRETKRGVDVMWAPHFHATDVDPDTGNVRVDGTGAIVASFGQRFLDANVHIERLPEETTVRTPDVASLLELLLGQFDLMDLVPNPVSDSDSLRLIVNNATLGQPVVDIRVSNDGLDFFIGLPGIRLDLEGEVALTGTPLLLNGSVTLVTSANVQLRVQKPSADEPLDIAVTSISVALERAEPDFASEELNALFALAESALFGTIERLVVTTLEEAVVDALPGLLDGALGTLETALVGLELPLDLGLGGEVITLLVDGRLTSVLPANRTALAATLDLDVGTNMAPRFPDSRGVAMNHPFDKPAPLFTSSRIQIGFKVATINGLLHALWNSGLLTFDAGGLLPPEVSVLFQGLQLDGRMPPHLTPTRSDTADYAFVLTLGQLEMILTMREKQDRVAVNVTVGANIDVVDGALTLTLAPEPIVKSWMVEQLGPTPIFEDASALESVFVAAVWPRVTEQLGEGLTIALPEIDLSSLGEMMPGVESLALQLALDRPIAIREGFFVLDGGLDGIATFSE